MTKLEKLIHETDRLNLPVIPTLDETDITKNISVQVGLMTPEIATELMHYNVANRTPTRTHVNVLKSDMEAGLWVMNGAPIILTQEAGRWHLVDGQHRLMACVQSGCSFQTVLITGAEAKSFMTLDTGRRRSLGQILKMSGNHNIHTLAGGLGWLFRMNYGGKQRMSVPLPSIQARMQLLDDNPAFKDYGGFVGRYGQLHSISGAPSFLGAMGYILEVKLGVHTDDVAAFFLGIAEGTGLQSDDPRYFIRELMIKSKTQNLRISWTVLPMLYIDAWNAWRAGIGMTKFTKRDWATIEKIEFSV